MSMKQSNAIIAFIALSLLLAGCAASTPSVSGNGAASARSPIVIVKERSFANCPKYSAEKSFAIVSNTQSWREHQRAAVLVPNDLRQWNPDFSRSTVIALSLGQNQTQGMRVHSGQGIKRIADELQVPVVIARPARGAAVGSAAVNPCMYLQVMGADYKVISVFEQESGRVLFKSAM